MKYIKFILLTCFSFCFAQNISESLEKAYELSVRDTVDMIVFSYDRPLQLRAFFDSVEKHVIGLGKIYVIYRTSSSEFDQAYDKCFSLYPQFDFILKKQSSSPRSDFKSLVMQTLSECSEYMLFAVDDIVVTNPVNLRDCLGYMRSSGAYGFYLRMGTHITSSYTSRQEHINQPTFKQLDDRVLSWRFDDPKINGCWKYPNTVDMTVYKTQSVIDGVKNLNFSTPNTFEGSWAIDAQRHDDFHKSALCYLKSKLINIPFNLVQDDWGSSRNMGMSKFDFLNLFNVGKKIDIERYDNLRGTSTHLEAPLYMLDAREEL